MPIFSAVVRTLAPSSKFILLTVTVVAASVTIVLFAEIAKALTVQQVKANDNIPIRIDFFVFFILLLLY